MQYLTTQKSCSKHRNHTHFILPLVPHSQSFAALLLLKKEYMLSDPEENPLYRNYLYQKRRKQVLREHFETYGKYICAYCKRDDLAVTFKQKDPRLVTIDHVIPISRGGSFLRKSNMVVACNKCNNKKSDTLL